MRRRALLVLVCAALCAPACDREWRAAVLGDADVGARGATAAPVLERLLEVVEGADVDLVLFAGDLVHGRTVRLEETHRQYDLAAAYLGRLAPRLGIVPGNHDVDGAGGRERYERDYGEAPWSMRHKGWTLLGLSTEKPGLRGRLGEDQVAWLRQRLDRREEKGRTVVLMHRPVWPAAEARGTMHSVPMPDLHRLFVREGVTAVFAGHEHGFREQERDGVLYVVTGGAGADLLPGEAHHLVLAVFSGDAVGVRPRTLDAVVPGKTARR